MAREIVICCGINRSGSTWVYQVMQELYKDGNVKDLGFIGDDITVLKEAASQSDVTILAKMHNHPEGLKLELEDQNVKLIYSHRDLRACILSLMKKTDRPFEKVYKMPFFHDAVYSLSDWQSYKSICYIDYKDIRTQGEKAVNQIVNYLGVDNIDASEVTNKFSLESQKKRIKTYKRSPKVMFKILLHKLRLAPMPKDESSLLHFNHIQSGRIEEWKEVYTSKQNEAVKVTYSEWMLFFKYE